MIKNEVLYFENEPYSIITRDAFRNDVTVRIAMQWLRDHAHLKATVVEVPEDIMGHCLLPGLIATLPRMQRVIVRCLPWQREMIEQYTPWCVQQKLELADHDSVVTLGIAKDVKPDGSVLLETTCIRP